MDNTKLPAYPLPIANLKEGEIMDTTDYGKGNAGFTKLELASLMIAQGLCSRQLPEGDSIRTHLVAEYSVELAKAVLQECNK